MKKPIYASEAEEKQLKKELRQLLCIWLAVMASLAILKFYNLL